MDHTRSMRCGVVSLLVRGVSDRRGGFFSIFFQFLFSAFQLIFFTDGPLTRNKGGKYLGLEPRGGDVCKHGGRRGVVCKLINRIFGSSWAIRKKGGLVGMPTRDVGPSGGIDIYVQAKQESKSPEQ